MPTVPRATVDAVRTAFLETSPTLEMPTRLRRGQPIRYRMHHAATDAEGLLIRHVIHSAQTRCGVGGLTIGNPARRGGAERLPTVPKAGSTSNGHAKTDLEPGEYELVVVVELLALGLTESEFYERVGDRTIGGDALAAPDPARTAALHDVARQAADRRMHEIVTPITVIDDPEEAN